MRGGDLVLIKASKKVYQNNLRALIRIRIYAYFIYKHLYNNKFEIFSYINVDTNIFTIKLYMIIVAKKY